MERKFGKRLKELREEQGLSIQAFSKMIQMNASSICRWENGKQDITSDLLIRLADFFNVSTDYLLGRVDD